jgi:ABC-type glycerol-3-phosphate transport system permease component
MNNKVDTSLRIIIYVVLVVLAIIALFPFVWTFLTSLEERYILYKYQPKIDFSVYTLANYVELITETDFFIWLKNSLIVSINITFFSLFFSTLAGYAFAKKKFPLKKVLFYVTISTLMVSPSTRIVPLYLIFSRLNLIDTYPGLILPDLGSGLGVFIMTQFMKEIPDEILDAAKIDGCSELRIFWNVILPLCKPALATLAIFLFMLSWNEFIWALIVTSKSEMRVLPLGLAMLQGQHRTNWGMMMAGSITLFIPILVVYSILQKQFIQGVVISGLKE